MAEFEGRQVLEARREDRMVLGMIFKRQYDKEWLMTR